MSDNRFSWSGLFGCLIDQFLSIFTGFPTYSKLPKMEATDGQEPTEESRCEEARKIDANPSPAPPRQLSSVSSKTLDKEFWEAF